MRPRSDSSPTTVVSTPKVTSTRMLPLALSREHGTSPRKRKLSTIRPCVLPVPLKKTRTCFTYSTRESEEHLKNDLHWTRNSCLNQQDDTDENAISSEDNSSETSHSPLVQSHLDQCEMELETLRKQRGPHHPELARIHSRMALMYQHMIRNLDTALEHHHKAIRILDKAMSTTADETDALKKEKAMILGDVAFVHEVQLEPAAALCEYWHALRIFQSIPTIDAEKHPRAISMSQSVRRLCRCSSRTEDGCRCYKIYPTT